MPGATGNGGPAGRGRKFTADFGGGFAGSVLLHLLAGLALVFFIRVAPPPASLRAIPVDIVRLEKQSAPPGPAATTPRPRAPQTARAASRASEQSTAAPDATRPPPDQLEVKLEALARLKASDSDPRLEAPLAAPGDLAGGNGHDGAYSVRDFVRAAVERHWNPDIAALGARDVTIVIHLTMRSDGAVTKAEIVDHSGNDPVYRTLAISARNAVLLSSPIALPPGRYDPVMDITLNLDPKDTLR